MLTIQERYQNGRQSIGQESYQEKGMTQYALFRSLILREAITLGQTVTTTSSNGFSGWQRPILQVDVPHAGKSKWVVFIFFFVRSDVSHVQK
jgi:hypothetical protein